MPLQIEANSGTNGVNKIICDCNLFESQEDMTKSLSRFCYGNLYVIGSLWIEALKIGLVGQKMSLIPVVEAETVHAASKEEPQKPPKMKTKDLPIYQNPHADYKHYLEDKQKCPDYKVKVLHETLLPYVSEYRQNAQDAYKDAVSTAKQTCKTVCGTIESKKKELKAYLRDPDNLLLRRVFVATGATFGYYIGCRKGYLTRSFIFAGIGALFTGYLAFPKETDEYFREFCYNSAKTLLMLYNFYNSSNVAMRERLPCEKDIPVLKIEKRKDLCPKK